jgi:uncharacterized protein
MISKSLLSAIIEQYTLPLDGPHGLAHWARVLENGRLLALVTGANLQVVELFAVLHDAKRLNERRDPALGRRAAEYVRSLHHSLGLAEEDLELLVRACAYHVDGLVEGDVTVRTCWDADRLDICRVGIHLDRRYLCTEAAREPDMMRAAIARGVERSVPEWVGGEWKDYVHYLAL